MFRIPVLALLLAGCGDYVCLPEGTAQDTGAVVITTDPPPPITPTLDLSESTTLLHATWDAALRLGTVEQWESPGLFRMVDYGLVSSNPEMLASLQTYIGGLSTVDPSKLANQEEKLAYWINAYNAWVLYAVAEKYAEDENYNVESDGWAIFSTAFIQVGEWVLTPNDLEHGLIRGWVDQPFATEELADQAAIWHDDLWDGAAVDARIHMGLNCASRSCPSVSPGAYQAVRVWDQLDQMAAEFLENTEKGAGPDGISTLFNWYGDDFRGSHGTIEAFIEAYRSSGTADVNYESFLTYGWTLNDATDPAGEEPTCASPW